MKFNVGDVLLIENKSYRVAGIISYRDPSDNCCWDEYRLFTVVGGTEHWLSIDDQNKEYSIWQKAYRVDKTGYHMSDSGTQIVRSCAGNVDVDPGERSTFVEYEDATEELIISIETWSDEVETSTGYYLDEDEISVASRNPHPNNTRVYGGSSGNNRVSLGSVIAVFIAFIFFGLMSIIPEIEFTPKIASYLKKSENYKYVTSITGNENQKADVYSVASGMSLDMTVRNIINNVNGKVEYVQQDIEEEENGADSAVGILTSKEYCLVYVSEDGPVMIQVSNRKYAYTSDHDVYHASTRTRHYYRRFYYSRGYKSDSSHYSKSNSPYSSYSSSDTISYSSSDSYSSYASSVRQSSINSRSSSGGGLSSGK